MVSAITAPRLPSGFSEPTVESFAVWCSISALSSPPSKITMAEIHIHIIMPTAAPSDPYVALYAPKWPMYQEKRAEVINHPMAAAPLPTESHCQRASARLGPYR